MAVKIGGASIDERGKATGGKAGDQTGREVRVQDWYAHKKGWRVFRPKSARTGDMISDDMRWACGNKYIGYDQAQRDTLYKAAQPHKFDCAEVKTPCETDCSALVRVCCAYAGIMLPNFNTSTEANALLRSGAFVEMIGAKYTKSSDYLRRGDVLVTRTKGHTVVVLNDGPLCEVGPEPEPDYNLGDRVLKNGLDGEDVKELQKLLIEAGYSCGPWGPDGDFGDATEAALARWQEAHGLEIDGIYGPESHAAMMEDQRESGDGEPLRVRVTGGQVNVREAPTVSAGIIGVVYSGMLLHFDGEISENGWYLVQHNGRNGWISGKYGRLVE